MSPPGTSQTRPWLGALVAGTVAALLLIPYVLPLPQAEDSELGIMLAILMTGLIAGLLVARRPDHPISWLLTGAAFIGAVAGLGAELLVPGLTEMTWWQATLAIVSGPAWYALLLIFLGLIPLLFPTGSPISPRWWGVGWTFGAALAVASALWMLQEAFCTDWDASDVCLTQVPNPIGVAGITNPEESSLGGLLFGVLLVGAVLSILSLVFRFRRSGPLERQQIKWVAFTCVLFVAFGIPGDGLWASWLGAAAANLITQVLWVMIPASIAVAILRYRLYEIDRIVSRTLSYTLIGLVLAAVWVGVVLGIQTLLPVSDDLAVAASTLTAVVVFAPLRRRVRQWVDRRFNRRRYDAERVVSEFTSRLRDSVALDSVTADLHDVVSRTLEPSTTAVWLRSKNG